MSPRLTGLADLPPSVLRPGYDPAAHGAGILHRGLGAFHRARQAVFTDDASAAKGGDWRIAGAALPDLARPAGSGDAALTLSVMTLPGLAPAAITGNPVPTETVQTMLTRICRDGLRPVMKAELAR